MKIQNWVRFHLARKRVAKLRARFRIAAFLKRRVVVQRMRARDRIAAFLKMHFVVQQKTFPKITEYYAQLRQLQASLPF